MTDQVCKSFLKRTALKRMLMIKLKCFLRQPWLVATQTCTCTWNDVHVKRTGDANFQASLVACTISGIVRSLCL